MGLAAVVSAPPIEVVMAVHNGAAWLEAQVATIAEQSHRPWRLLVLDDGSRDGSGDRLRALERSYGGWLQQLPPQPAGQNRGCGASYGALLAATKAPYVALADQDDLWDPGKLALSLESLLAEEAQHGCGQPLLVHTDARVIDAPGGLLAPSWRAWADRSGTPRGLGHLALRNQGMGCTMLLNRACVEAALPIPPEAVLHDWWLALVAYRAGGLRQLPQATLSHRRHGANASQSARCWQLPRRGWAIWRQWRALQRHRSRDRLTRACDRGRLAAQDPR